MADKILKTRISLKYGAIGEWSSTFKPLKGEVCFSEVSTEKKDAAGNIISVPAVVFKVGDGVKTFGELPWTSALAADVYDWAKMSQEEFETYLTTFIGEKVEDTNDNTTYAFEIPAEGENKGKLVITETPHVLGVAGNATTTVLDFITPEELTAALGNYYTKEEADAKFAPIGIDTGVHSVSLATGTNDKTLKLTVDGEETDNIEVKNIYSKSEVDSLVQSAKDYADSNDTNETFVISYNKEEGKIYLTGSDGTNSEIPTADFIKDGMINTVTIGEDNDLIITFNTDAGKENIVLPLDQLVDIYTGSEGTNIKVTVTSDKKIEADLTDAVKASLAKADSALQEHQDISGKKDKQTAVDNKITNSAHVLSTLSQNANGDIAYEVKELTPADIGAQAAGDYALKSEIPTEFGVMSVTTNDTADKQSGIKVDNTDPKNPKVEVDDTITWIFDCGGAE